MRDFFGPDFRERFQVAAKNHYALLRLAGTSSRYGWSQDKVLETLLSLRDARVARNPENSRSGGVGVADINAVVQEIIGPEIESAIDNEAFAKEAANTVPQREGSAGSSADRLKRHVLAQSGESAVLMLRFLADLVHLDESDGDHRELRPTARRRYNEDESAEGPST